MGNLIDSNRRTFLRRGAMGAGAVWALSLQELSARSGHRGPVVIDGVSPYGPISPRKDESTGLELLKLPAGFRYWSHSWTGDMMTDGVVCPNLHDGMAVVDEWRFDEDADDADEREKRTRAAVEAVPPRWRRQRLGAQAAAQQQDRAGSQP